MKKLSTSAPQNAILSLVFLVLEPKNGNVPRRLRWPEAWKFGTRIAAEKKVLLVNPEELGTKLGLTVRFPAVFRLKMAGKQRDAI